MHKVKALIFSILFFSSLFWRGTGGEAFSQTFPVTITTQLAPPFTGYLPDYSAAGGDKLRLLLLFNDFSKPSYNVKLKIKISGQGITLESKPFYFEGPFEIIPGFPTQISGDELGGLLNSNNLDFSGITKAQYELRKVLPEGFYSVCITAYDYINPNNIKVSNESCAYGMMILSDPPYLNIPGCGASLSVTNPQQITFNWTPINQVSPNSALQTDYVLELFEVRPAGQNPNNITQTLPPIFTETLNITSFNYGITEPPLITGMEYVWRVRAIDQTGRDVFKNQGYSQICTFTYGNQYTGANIGINLAGVPLTHKQIKCTWDSLNVYSKYKLEFKKVGGTPTWFPVNTTNAQTKINGLEPNTDYLVHVTGEFPEGGFGPQSNEITIHTPNAPVYNCGDLPPPINTQNYVPLTNASDLQIWDIGQFEVLVTSLTNYQSPTGQYTGTGKVMMGFANSASFPVTFTNVTVSNDMVVVAGRMDVVSKGIDQWLTQNNVGYFTIGEDETEINTNTTNPNITVNTGNGTINVGGQTYNFDPNYGNTVTDGNGNITVITPGGQVIQIGNANGQPVPANKKYINSNVGTVQFNATPKQLYGYDKFQFSQWLKWYEKTNDIATNTQLPVDWKSVQAIKYDMVELNIQLVNSNFSLDSVFVRSGTGTIYKQQLIAGKRYIYFVGSQPQKSQELFVSIRLGDSIVNIGKLNTINYELQQKVVNIVPFNSTKSFNATTIQNQLNRAYVQALIKWVVNIKPALNIPTSEWDLNGNANLNCGSNLFAKYSKEMLAINAKLKTLNDYSNDELYIIASGTAPDSLQSGLLGEMPRNRNIGYMFTNTNPNDSIFTQVIAHELGHGYATLEHTFPQLPSGSAQNLMDYPSSISMARFQWDMCQAPDEMAGLFDSDEDASLVETAYFSQYLKSGENPLIGNGYIPQWYWNRNSAVIDGSAIVCGFADAVCEDIGGAYDALKFGLCWSNPNPTAECLALRKKTEETGLFVLKVIQCNTVAQILDQETCNNINTKILNEIKKYSVASVTLSLPERAYLTGKMIYLVGGCFVGVTEIKAGLTAYKLSTFLNNSSKVSAKINAIIKVFTKVNRGIKKTATGIALYFTLNATDITFATINNVDKVLTIQVPAYLPSTGGNVIETITQDVIKVGNQTYNNKTVEIINDNGSLKYRFNENLSELFMPNNFFENVNDLGATFDQFQKLSSTLRGEIFNFYKQQKWDKLRLLFKEYKLNGGWPPANGGYNIIDDVPITKGMKFDRYQDWFKLDANGNPVFGGSFTSPIKNYPYNYPQRALKVAENQNPLYYEIEILKDLPIYGQSADVIPWFGQVGNGKQVMFKFQSKNGSIKNLQDLLDGGYIKIIIKSSPNSQYTNLVGKTFPN